jgi:spore germination protein
VKQIPLTKPQVIAILINSIIGAGILPMPVFPVRAADHGAPLITVLAFVMAYIGLACMALLGSRFPKQNFVTLSEMVIGKWPARFFTFLFACYLGALTAFTAREFGEVVITSVLKSTPLEVTVILMLVLGAVSARSDMNTFAYMHMFYVPFVVIPAWLIVFLSLKNAEPLNLLPIWGNESGNWFNGIIAVASLTQASFIITLVIPYMKNPEKALRTATLSILVTGSLYVAIVVACVGVFGPEEIKILLWPTLELAKTTSLPANILERLDAAFLALWLTAVFTNILSTYFFTVHAFSNVFKLRDYRFLTMFILPFIFVLAMQPKSIIQMYTDIYQIGRVGYLILVGYAATLLLIAILRGIRGRRDGQLLEESS